MKRTTKIGVSAVFIAAVVAVIAVSQSNAVVSSNTHIVTKTATGEVTDSQNRPLVGATVYFIDAATINLTPITVADIISTTRVAEGYDEPLEDIVRDPVKAKALPQAVTDKNGKYHVKGLNVNSTFFAFVVPAAKDTQYIPGGDATRVAFTAKSIAKGLHIHMSWNFSSDATYIGTTACLNCHNGTTASDQTGSKRHMHSLVFQVPGKRTAHQDISNYPNMDQFINKFTLATKYSDTGVKVLYFDTYDATQSQKYLIWEDTDTGFNPANAIIKLYLWKTADNKYHVTFQNVINPTDPNNFMTRDVAMTLGGYLRQRLLLNVPGKLGAFQFIQFQAFNIDSQGRNSNYFFDRSRRAFQEAGTAGGGITSFFSYNATTPSKSTLIATAPSSGATSCAACHMGGNTKTTAVNATTGETLASTVADPNGVYDSNGDGQLDDLGITCESCHGPGSRHQAEAMAKSDAIVLSKKDKQPLNAKYIVNPKLLGSDRSSLICGRCHNGGRAADTANNFPPPGLSRNDYINNYTNPTGTTPTSVGVATTALWPDGVHEKGGHEGLAYSTFIRGAHYRNNRILVACSDCHGLHGEEPIQHALLYDPNDSASPLCQRCHERDVTKHIVEKTGSAMNGSAINCVQCHMEKTGKGGAGRAGIVLGTPTGAATDGNLIYWQNDQTSHIMDMPRKFSRGVAGVAPGSIPYTTNPQVGAMPVPYTNACGTCHNATTLQYQQPQ